MLPNLSLPKCSACEGMGRVVIVVDGYYTTTRCAECGGEGRK
jgi:DnaJ-class molecular chaperone